MIKVSRKGYRTPMLLRGAYLKNWRGAINHHFSLPRDERLKRRAPLDERILEEPMLREELVHLFHGKCAFCESKVKGSMAQVDHFRPLRSAITPGEKADSPDHYSWFAYEWRNLLFVCVDCHMEKNNLFPVSGPRALPMCSWTEAQTDEDYGLLDPCTDDPYKHLTFDREGLAIGLSERGQITIETLNLNRPKLVQQRKYKITETLSEFERWDSEWVLSYLSNVLRQEEPYSGVLALYLHSVCLNIRRQTGLPVFPYSRLVDTITLVLRKFPIEVWQQAIAASFNDFPSPKSSQFYISERALVSPSFRASRNMGAWIKKIHIENFKGVSSLTLDFGQQDWSRSKAPCAMLLGENSTGKSSVLQAIALTLMGKRSRGNLRIDPEEFLSRERANWHLTADRELNVTIDLDSEESISLHAGGESTNFDGEPEAKSVLLAYGARRFFDASKRVNSGSSNYRTLFKPLATLPDPTTWLQKTDNHSFDAVARAMREILALKEEDQIFRDDEKRVLVNAHGRESPVERLSDGYRSLFAMAIDIMREMVEFWGNLETARGIVLIDEIETHLHPRWKMRVMSALRDAMPLVQFIVTTHDPLCLRGMKNGEVHVLYRNTNADVEVMDDLPNVTGLRAEQLLTSDYFGLASTSDPETERLLEELAALAAKSDAKLTKEEKAKRDSLLTMFEGLPLIGDSPDRQIVAEAFTRYLKQRSHLQSALRKEIREDAVNSILSVLMKEKRV